MRPYSSDSLKNALKNQVRRLQKKMDDLEQLSNRISYIRFFDFVLLIVLVYLAAQSGNTWIFFAILITGLLIFGGLVRYHQKINDAIDRFEELKKIRSHHLARMNLDWNNIPAMEWTENYDSHPFARDFDVVGKHSLTELVNIASYPGGRKRLEGWLLTEVPQPTKLGKRQKLLKELTPMAHFRDRLHLYAELTQKNKSERDWSMDDLQLWLQSTQRTGFTLPLAILGSLAALNIILLVLYLVGTIGPYVIFTVFAYLITYNFYSKKTSGLFHEAKQISNLLDQFKSVLKYLESYPYKSGSELESLCEVYHSGDQQPSQFLKKIIRISSAASSQSSELLWFMYNLVVPWDMYFAKKLNDFKSELAPRLDRWLDTFYRLEALNSIANYAWLNPGYTYALPSKDQKKSPVLKATGLGHPLIHKSKKVTNDMSISDIGSIHLITGSNMSGKSTYLRTVGINLILANAGAPVNATSFDAAYFRLFSSINVTDSLDEGLSHFYAEVKRLRALMDELQRSHDYPLFFMVDEIYRGTNNRERLTGSEAFLKHVAGKDGVGMVTTHDLELARLEDEIPTLSNWHFEETIENGKMRFEYKLKPGPCPSTNALKIMEMEGLPV